MNLPILLHEKLLVPDEVLLGLEVLVRLREISLLIYYTFYLEYSRLALEPHFPKSVENTFSKNELHSINRRKVLVFFGVRKFRK